MAASLAGCARPPQQTELMDAALGKVDKITTASAYVAPKPSVEQPLPKRIFKAQNIAGRTLAVAATSDIVLKPREVIITFDDGPRAASTPLILDALDAFGVKATFLMLGSSAVQYPDVARLVAARGHSVGSHTYDHVDLTKLERQEAITEILRGEEAVAEVLRGSGGDLSPFFRFPYLAQSGFLRTSVMAGSMVVLDVDIDSKDYYKDTPQVVAQRTLDRLEARGSGIILFHDIHQRTVEMLPEFLSEIAARGYSVVHLVPRTPGIFGRPVITADVPAEADQI